MVHGRDRDAVLLSVEEMVEALRGQSEVVRAGIRADAIAAPEELLVLVDDGSGRAAVARVDAGQRPCDDTLRAGRRSAWQSARFGTARPAVRICPPRP